LEERSEQEPAGTGGNALEKFASSDHVRGLSVFWLVGDAGGASGGWNCSVVEEKFLINDVRLEGYWTPDFWA
jgi:hypothetical protein